LRIRARACLACKEYLIIHPNNPININALKVFEKNHERHTIITVDLSEIEKNFTNVQSKDYKNFATMSC
jgi:hypothetical protein